MPYFSRLQVIIYYTIPVFERQTLSKMWVAPPRGTQEELGTAILNFDAPRLNTQLTLQLWFPLCTHTRMLWHPSYMNDMLKVFCYSRLHPLVLLKSAVSIDSWNLTRVAYRFQRATIVLFVRLQSAAGFPSARRSMLNDIASVPFLINFSFASRFLTYLRSSYLMSCWFGAFSLSWMVHASDLRHRSFPGFGCCSFLHALPAHHIALFWLNIRFLPYIPGGYLNVSFLSLPPAFSFSTALILTPLPAFWLMFPIRFFRTLHSAPATLFNLYLRSYILSFITSWKRFAWPSEALLPHSKFIVGLYGESGQSQIHSRLVFLRQRHQVSLNSAIPAVSNQFSFLFPSHPHRFCTKPFLKSPPPGSIARYTKESLSSSFAVLFTLDILCDGFYIGPCSRESLNIISFAAFIYHQHSPFNQLFRIFDLLSLSYFTHLNWIYSKLQLPLLFRRSVRFSV